MNNVDLVDNMYRLCYNNGNRPLYLVKFGSHLYGTNTKTSDTDAKGLFLPDKRSLLLGNHCKHLSINTGDPKGKNTPEDVDLQLWSLHYWFDLIQLGDTNALDLLYSYTNPTMILFKDPEFLDFIKENHNKFYNKNRLYGYLGYCLSQCKKYGIKGSRLGVIKRVKEWLDNCHPKVFLPGSKLSFWGLEILDKCSEPSYCFTREINGEMAIVICGKVHYFSISMEEFRNRIDRDFERYGERARLASLNEGVDWKAVSHAFRAVYQMKQILTSGSITFPLECADFLKSIKQGEISWEECEVKLLADIEEVKVLQNEVEENAIDVGLINSFILSQYNQ